MVHIHSSTVVGNWDGVRITKTFITHATNWDISTILYHTPPYSIILYNTLPYSTILYHTLPYLPYSTILYHTLPYLPYSTTTPKPWDGFNFFFFFLKLLVVCGLKCDDYRYFKLEWLCPYLPHTGNQATSILENTAAQGVFGSGAKC